MPGPQDVEQVPHCPGTQCGELPSGVVKTVQKTKCAKFLLEFYRVSLDPHTHSWADVRS